MSRHDTSKYYALIERLILDQHRVWGNVAIDIADSVPGLVVADAMTESVDIWVNGNEKEIAAALAQAYIGRFGQSTASSLRAVASDYEDDIELPEVLES